MMSIFLFKETGLGALLPAICEASLQMYDDEREIENHFWHTLSICMSHMDLDGKIPSPVPRLAKTKLLRYNFRHCEEWIWLQRKIIIFIKNQPLRSSVWQ